MLKTTAEKYGLKTISDLEGVSEKLSLYGSPECRERIDCLAGLEKLYGLKFKSFHPVDIGLRYTVLEKGQADLSILFTTDPQLSAEKDKFVILEDDKHVFPAGNVIFVTKKSTAEEAGPDYEKTIVEVQKGLTLPVMQELDARVELEKETAKEAASPYLEGSRLHRLGVIGRPGRDSPDKSVECPASPSPASPREAGPLASAAPAAEQRPLGSAPGRLRGRLARLMRAKQMSGGPGGGEAGDAGQEQRDARVVGLRRASRSAGRRSGSSRGRRPSRAPSPGPASPARPRAAGSS